jgi:hypothetical protein
MAEVYDPGGHAPSPEELNCVPCYNGNNCPEFWLYRLEGCAELFGWDAASCLLVGQHKLTQQALQWSQRQSFPDWIGFKQQLLARFGDCKTTAALRLQNCWQQPGECALDFADRFLHAAMRAGRSEDAALLLCFSQRLLPDLQQEVARQRLQSIQQVATFCQYWVGLCSDPYYTDPDKGYADDLWGETCSSGPPSHPANCSFDSRLLLNGDAPVSCASGGTADDEALERLTYQWQSLKLLQEQLWLKELEAEALWDEVRRRGAPWVLDEDPADSKGDTRKADQHPDCGDTAELDMLDSEPPTPCAHPCPVITALQPAAKSPANTLPKPPHTPLNTSSGDSPDAHLHAALAEPSAVALGEQALLCEEVPRSQAPAALAQLNNSPEAVARCKPAYTSRTLRVPIAYTPTPETMPHRAAVPAPQTNTCTPRDAPPKGRRAPSEALQPMLQLARKKTYQVLPEGPGPPTMLIPTSPSMLGPETLPSLPTVAPREPTCSLLRPAVAPSVHQSSAFVR